jgi:hypothetical protein
VVTVYRVPDAEPDSEDIPPDLDIDSHHASADPHHFEFDLDRGIRDQAVQKLEGSPQLELKKGIGPAKSGIYALYFKGRLVYIGKASKDRTKSKRTLRARLNEHVAKLSGRRNLTLEEMTCRYLTLASDWWVFAAEFALIAHYKPEWNGSGYGSKVPGKGRPGTHRVSKWNLQFPKR